MKTGSITYNGKNSLTDLGIYVTGSGSFDAAELDVDRYEVAGRNGDIIIPKNRYKNISISYPAFIPKGFDGKVQSVRNWLRSAKTYARLEDTYNMNHYRLGLASGIQSFEPANRNDASNFALTFDCKPQRFLKTGETESKVNPSVGTEDKVPYLFKAVEHDGRDSETDLLVGGTIAWNQFVDDGNFADSTKWTTQEPGSTLSFSNGVATVAYDSGPLSVSRPAIKQVTQWQTISGHKYLISIDLKASKTMSGAYFRSNALGNFSTGFAVDTTWRRFETIKTASSVNSGVFYIGNIGYADMSVGDSISFKNYCAFDLTQIFGTTIADYIYALETANAGAGVAWFRKLFPKPYYAYNAGQLMSVKTSKHKMVGFNAYDSTTGKAKVVGGNQYQITGTFSALSLDGETITPDASGYFTPSASGEITVTGGNGTDTCIHLVWDGERDGEYEEYKAWEYPLDSDLELRGIPKLSAGNDLYYDGDEYESDGTVVRKYGVVDLGTLTYGRAESSVSGVYRFSSDISGLAAGGNASIKVICSKYTSYLSGEYASHNMSIASGTGGTYIYIRDDSYTDAATFKTAMSGVYLVYELAEPTTESADPYQNPQIVDDFGTEEYVDERTVAIPVGHDTTYRDTSLELTNPTQEEARPLFRLVNPQQNDVITLNGKTITISSSYTGEMFIDCESMDAFSSSGTNLNSYITATDFPVLEEGLNIVTFTGSGDIYITPRWWEL